MKEQDAAHSFEKTHPDFPQWIKTKDGLECMMWPITDEKYLYNRLSWAFDAGRNCVWDQYVNQTHELTSLRSELQQERELRKELVGGLEITLDYLNLLSKDLWKEGEEYLAFKVESLIQKSKS